MTAEGRWSPDGDSIVFESNREGSFDLYRMKVSGGGFPRRLTTDPGVETAATWSRNGRWICFTSDRSGRLEAYRMPAEGGEPVQLTRHGGTVSAESPDGQHLYYAKSASATFTSETLSIRLPLLAPTFG